MYNVDIRIKKVGQFFNIFGVIFSGLLAGGAIYASIMDKESSWNEKLLGTSVFFLFFLYMLYCTIKTAKRIKDLKYLLVNGTLFENVKYISSEDGKKRDDESNTYMYRPIIKYTLPDGREINIIGDYNFNIIKPLQEGEMDLLIDLNNLNRYYIDFNIKKNEV